MTVATGLCSNCAAIGLIVLNLVPCSWQQCSSEAQTLTTTPAREWIDGCFRTAAAGASNVPDDAKLYNEVTVEPHFSKFKKVYLPSTDTAALLKSVGMPPDAAAKVVEAVKEALGFRGYCKDCVTKVERHLT